MQKVLALISGGIDSPVAAYLIGKLKKIRVVPIYFDNQPFAEEKAKEKALTCIRKLGEHLNIKEAYIFPHGENLKEISEKCARKFTCILCRRLMFRVAERFSEIIKASGLVTGESLGQVASQTLQNIFVEDKAVKLPVLRPLIGLNKEETVRIAEKIGTYKISIEKAVSCLVNPPQPTTKANLDKILGEEKKLDIFKLVSQTVLSRKKISLT